MSSTRPLNFTMSFHTIVEPADELWEALVNLLQESDALPKLWTLSSMTGRLPQDPARLEGVDMKLTSAGVLKEIQKKQMTGFNVSTGYTEHSVAFSAQIWRSNLHPDHAPHFLITTRIEKNSKAPASWGSFFEKVLSTWGGIGAWQFQRRYNSWQNATVAENSYINSFGAEVALENGARSLISFRA